MEPASSNEITPLAGNKSFLKFPGEDMPAWKDREESSVEFICRLCKKTFYNAKALQNHKNAQHDIDDSSTEGEPNISKHVRTLNGIIYDFKFVPCPKSAGGIEQITDDGLTIRTYAEDTSYLIIKLDDLNMSMDSHYDGLGLKSQLKSTKEPVDLRGPFTCTFLSTMRPELQCSQIFFNCCEYSLHYREEHTKRRKAALRCQVCEKRLDQIHPVNRFTCRVCGQTFMTSGEYEEHNRLAHAKMKPHQCSVCSKRFTQQGGLQQHMRMHTGIRPFACTFCPKAFTQKAGLDQHIRTHTKVKPFKCVVCSKGFSQSVHLRQHMRTHTNIQPFECSVCGKRFKQSSHLNFHMRSHSGEEGALVVDRYAHEMPRREQMEYLQLANVQPVRDGETMYYAAELAPGPSMHDAAYGYQPYEVIPKNVLSM